MKAALLFAALLAFNPCLYAMGNVSALKAKADAAKAEKEKQMIASIDMLENYDVLLKMDILMDIKDVTDETNNEVKE